MERNGRFTFGWCISYRPFHNPPRKEVEAKIVSSQKMAIDCNLYLRCEQKF